MEIPEFENADPHERMLWECATLAWTSVVASTHPRVGKSPDGKMDYSDIDLRKCPSIEICDERFVRMFTVEAGSNDSINFKLSDPIREVDPALDETYLDHIVVYANGVRFRVPRHEHAPERMLNVVARLIPRRNREAIVGDIYEDLHDMRIARYRDLYVSCVVLWQVSIAVVSEMMPRIWRFMLRLFLIEQVRIALRHLFAG